MDAYGLQDGRFIQEKNKTSPADATAVFSTVAPEGKVWTLLSASYYPSAAETRTVQFIILTRGGSWFAISIPISIALSGAIFLPLLTEGMELKLFPGDGIGITRDVATAGSTMNLGIRFIESDLPYYSYEEPLKKVVSASQKHGSVYRATGGIAEGRTAGEIVRGERGPGGRPEPI